jgi:uncharacterized protein (DUF2132 family)
LVESYGFPYLAERVKINCFKSDPSIKSSLKFLRRTLWAREQVEKLYVAKFAKAGHPPRHKPLPTKSKAKAKADSNPVVPTSQPESTPAPAAPAAPAARRTRPCRRRRSEETYYALVQGRYINRTSHYESFTMSGTGYINVGRGLV